MGGEGLRFFKLGGRFPLFSGLSNNWEMKIVERFLLTMLGTRMVTDMVDGVLI